MGFQNPDVGKGILMEHDIGAPLSSKYHTAQAIDATVGMGIDMLRPINEPLEKSWNPTLGKRLHRVHCYSLYVGVVSPYPAGKTKDIGQQVGLVSIVCQAIVKLRCLCPALHM